MLTRMARLLTRMARMLTRMTRWLADYTHSSWLLMNEYEIYRQRGSVQFGVILSSSFSR